MVKCIQGTDPQNVYKEIIVKLLFCWTKVVVFGM